ncbi:MAG: hypothetical protein JRH11_24390, partial [Deltaproteobacteria bacterium]|nr:hypothetical protein [Deltaproteobacteria bacterium]
MIKTMLFPFRLVPSIFIALFFGAAVTVSACGDSTGTPSDGSADGSMDSSGDGSTGGGGPGSSCATVANCQVGLDCVSGVCTATSNGETGDPCIYTDQCMAGLYCSIPRTCQAEGAGGMF